MEKIFEFVKNFNWKQIIATAILIATLSFCTFYFSSCNIAKTLVSGDKIVDKNVRDSTHYEVVLEK